MTINRRRRRWVGLFGLVFAAALGLTACGGGTSESTPDAVSFRGYVYPAAPQVGAGPLPEGIALDVKRLYNAFRFDDILPRLEDLGASGDARLAWVIADYATFNPGARLIEGAIGAFEELTGVTLSDDPAAKRIPARSMVNHLIAWDLPAPPEYRELKRIPFEERDARWRPFFEDEDSTIDWRLISWGGVFLDNRPFEDPKPCPSSCIAALDNPAVTDAAGGDWYPDHRLVFGIVINGEARAYPKNIMESHEMVNDTIGGRDIGFAFCTLCGSAVAFFTDDLPEPFERPILRTSGLLSRSNKVTFDLITFSIIDTFTGEARSGPLREAGIFLTPVTVVTSTWGDWKMAHPDTTIVAEDGGIGKIYPLDPLGNRDAGGPIFPVGDVDGRLPGRDEVLGVTAPDGTPIAFSVNEARVALALGQTVELGGVTIVAAGSALTAIAGGEELISNQAFWFAWSQFHPETLLWSPGGLADQ